jgi:zinc transport system substrate-binding protein
MRLRLSKALFTVMFCALLCACGGDSTPTQQVGKSNPFIVAVNSPLQYFAQRLLGDEIEVRMLAPTGTDPAQWQPKIEDILQLQQAKLILLNGAGYSNWLNKVSLSEEQLLVTSATASDKWIELTGQVSHSHGPKGEHAHSGYAFTTWMDMRLAQVQAKAVAKALQMQWPEKQADIEGKLASLLAELESLDRGYVEVTIALKKYQIVYSHPVYQYFERRYELPGISLHWEPNVMPSDMQWKRLQSVETDKTLLIWEAQPSPGIIQRMGEMKIEYVVVYPAANIESDEWLSVQQENIARLAAQH